MLIIIVLHAGTTEHAVLRCAVEVLEVGGLSHSLSGRNILHTGRRQDLAQCLEGLGVGRPVLLGECDVELDVHVAEVVVSVRRHTLAADHLDGFYSLISIHS